MWRFPASPLILVLALASCTPSPPAVATDQTPLLRGIDHFFATSADPEPLYRFFRDSLQWPEVYPFRDYGDFASGVVSAGNVLFEVVTWKVPAGETLPTELKGIAFEPGGDLPGYLATLRERGIPYAKPDSVMFTNDSGVRVLAYVNTGLDGAGGLPPSSASIFINDNLKHAGAPASRKTGSDELERRNGGPLGVLAVVELLIGVEDRDTALAQWRKVLGSPGQESQGVITFPAGPAMRFVGAAKGAIIEMVVRVRSLDRAKGFLAARGWLGSADGDVLIAPAAVGGLKIRLVE